MKTLRFIPLVIAAFALANPLPLCAQSPTAPRVALPTEIDAAGTTSQTITANTCRGFAAAPQTAAAQLRVTVSGVTYDFPAGLGWEMNSPNAERFANDVTLTALVGKFTISTIR